MKVAVSIPDHVFAEADEVAAELNLSRSGFYSQALREFLQRRKDDAITAQMNAAIDALGQPTDEFALAAGRRVFAATEW